VSAPLTEEERDRQRILRMRARKLRLMGKPLRVLPHEFERALKILNRAHLAGMTRSRIGDQIGLDRTTINQMMRGGCKTIRRESYEKILGLRIEGDIPVGRTRHQGAKLDSTATLRKIRALVAIGFPVNFLAPMLGYDHSSALRVTANNGTAFTYMATALDVDAAYEKLKHADPMDFGVIPGYARQAREMAAKKGWAPTWCWDEDTIGDPKAVPEYTGFCGTLEGFVTHKLNDIPMCPPCAAQVTGGAERDNTAGAIITREYDFKVEVLREAMERKRMSANALSEELGFSHGQVTKWLRGLYGPRIKAAVQLADRLDLLWTDLYERKST
jgi:transcriptional regulator with XRE-family HTH domain